MPDRLPPGPYRTLALDGGVKMPYYILPFDKRGVSQAPRTREHLLQTLRDGDTSDVFLFSHGWNNDWTVATQRYEAFIDGYRSLRQSQGIPFPPSYRPLLIGVFWPSTSLAFGEKEKGPQFASANGPAETDAAVAAERREIEELAAELPPDQAEALYRLAQKDTLTEAEARELAAIAIQLRTGDDDELGFDDALDVDEILAVWAAAADDDDDLSDLIADGGGGPQTAGGDGWLKKLDPRQLVRVLSVYQMKDRAGTVGAKGVAPLLRDVLRATDARVHAIGHSYGAKVVLSATGPGGPLPRKLHSMLLLQPAVSHLCFADAVPTTSPSRPGGYRNVLDRVDRPILSTYSAHDSPLTKWFHNALRRKADLGEERIAATGGKPPSRYAALGGFGPRGAGERLIDMLDPGTPYALDASVPIYGLDGTRTISDHGDISVPSTWWALHTLASS